MVNDVGVTDKFRNVVRSKGVARREALIVNCSILQ